MKWGWFLDPPLISQVTREDFKMRVDGGGGSKADPGSALRAVAPLFENFLRV